MATCILILADLERADPAPFQASDQTRSGDVSKRTLSNLVPPGYDGTKPNSAIIAFHGGGNPQQTVKVCGLIDKAEREGFLIVYPKEADRLASVR